MDRAVLPQRPARYAGAVELQRHRAGACDCDETAGAADAAEFGDDRPRRRGESLVAMTQARGDLRSRRKTDKELAVAGASRRHRGQRRRYR
jgi:hypothetical protein